MKKTAIASLLVGLMSLPAFAADYTMNTGVATPRHDSALGAINSEGNNVSVDYNSPKAAGSSAGLAYHFGGGAWGVGLRVPDIDTSGNMTVFGGYSFGSFELGLDYNMYDSAAMDADMTLHGRYLINDQMRVALKMPQMENAKNNTLGFAYDMNDITFEIDYNMYEASAADAQIDLAAAWYGAPVFAGLRLGNVGEGNSGKMQPTVEVGYNGGMWHASGAYNTESEKFDVHFGMHF